MPVAAPRKGTLIVRLLGRTVGRLDYSSHHNEMRFSYDPEYLADSMSMPLSRSLPLRSEPFDTETTTVFFENLLPPDQVRRKLGPILHVSRHNIFGFLEALGGDCAGAISLWPEDTPQEEESAARLEMLDEDAAGMVLKSLRKRPLYVNGVAGYRISGSGLDYSSHHNEMRCLMQMDGLRFRCSGCHRRISSSRLRRIMPTAFSTNSSRCRSRRDWG